MITTMDANRFATHSLNDPRIMRILSSAIEAVDPAEAVRKHLPKLTGSVHGLGIGKASVPMLTALAEAYPLSSALAISKHASAADPNLFPVLLGGHPVPNINSLRAGERALEFVSALNEDDTLICLISGGGSALMTSPHEGISLEDMQTLTTLLLASGARIDEINILRRQLDRVKGGGLARATKAKIVSLILSDVIGNLLEAIASGPAYPDPTTSVDALAVLKKYEIEEHTPKAILDYLRVVSSQTIKKHFVSLEMINIIIGDNRQASLAAMERAKHEGFDAEILTKELQGEAREAGVLLANKLKDDLSKRKRPFCLIAGGETTVTVKGDGKGGRNQELALAAVDELRGLENIVLISLATDGEDGPTNAAGAVVTGESAQRAEILGLSATGYLSTNDAYHYFEQTNDLIRTGPSGTNVNDLVFLIAS